MVPSVLPSVQKLHHSMSVCSCFSINGENCAYAISMVPSEMADDDPIAIVVQPFSGKKRKKGSSKEYPAEDADVSPVGEEDPGFLIIMEASGGGVSGSKEDPICL